MSDTPASAPGLGIGMIAQIEHGRVRAEGDSRRSDALAEGIELFTAAEALGYDVGYVRTRHLQDTLASPLLFLAALGQRVTRMQLGTAVIPLRFENPARLAEDLATCDLLLGGRLRAGLSSGYSSRDTMYAGAYGTVRGGVGDHVDRVLSRLLSLVDGEVVSHADAHIEGVDAGTPLQIRPQVPGLRSRLSYGAASPQRAASIGSRGMGLQLATMALDDGSGRSFETLQLDALHAYREASRAAGHGEGTVMVSRQMLPVATEEQLERYVSLIPRERSATPGTTGEYRGREIGGQGAVYGPVIIDDPSVVAQYLMADAVVREADELTLVLPFGASLEEQRGVLTTFAEQVVPHLVAGGL